MKIHCGCGNVKLPNYTNVDRRPGPAVDEVDDIRLFKYASNSLDEIYCCHALDHFDRWTYMSVLSRWFELLKPDGVLRLSMPDFEAIAAEYAEYKDLRNLQGILYARQDYEGNVRHFIWDYKMAAADLRQVGFVDVRRYDCRKTPFAHIDDCSQAFLPRGDKDGRLVSLNIMANKPQT